MKFYVYRSQKSAAGDRSVLIATTDYQSDAQAVLKNWYRGFITDGKGNRIHEKNMG